MGGQKYDATRIVVIPDYLFDRLISEDNGENLISLWIRYARQARMQNGEETKSYDSFMRKQLWWGISKFEAAKRALKRLGLIETERTKEGDWITKVYGEFEETGVSHTLKTNPLKTVDIPENPPIENQWVIDNIVYSNINNKEKKEKREKKIESNEVQSTVDGYIVNTAIKAFYDVLIEEGVPKKPEVNEFTGLNAIKALLKNEDFKRASESVGDAILLIQSVARYGAKDGFWVDKCNSLTGFSRNFTTLYLQAKAKGAIKPKPKTITESDLASLISGF